MITAEPGVALPLTQVRRITTRALFVDRDWAVWCERGPESTQGGYWWPMSASGCALYHTWAIYGPRALCEPVC